jgi:AraC family transcriptional regulator of adaptative response/methylated-DNA-[protein]-cysteine methyltransferase
MKPLEPKAPEDPIATSEPRPRQGSDELIYATGESSLGAYLVASSDRGVCALMLGDDIDRLIADLKAARPRQRLIPGSGFGYYEEIVAKAVGLIERPLTATHIDFALDFDGGDFERMVVAALRSLATGYTATPEAIATMIGASPASAQAVREVVATSLIAAALPFHRLQEADGAAPYYPWGEARRRSLLEGEKGGVSWWLYSPFAGPV